MVVRTATKYLHEPELAWGMAKKRRSSTRREQGEAFEASQEAFVVEPDIFCANAGKGAIRKARERRRVRGIEG